MVQFNVRHHQVVDAPETKIAQLAIMVFECSVAIATVAMANHVVIDLLNDRIHWRRAWH
jgi:hypothetical protein